MLFLKSYSKLLPLLVLIVMMTALLLIILKPSLITSKYVFDEKVLLTNIEKIGNLSVIRMNFQDVLDPTVRHSFFGLFDIPFVDSKALIVIRSEAEGCIDLTKVKGQDIKTDADSITITLPAPYVCHTKINLSESRTYDVNLIAKVLNPELPDLAKQEAEKNIAENAVRLGILDLAEENAKSILSPLLENLTGKKTIIEFSK